MFFIVIQVTGLVLMTAMVVRRTLTRSHLPLPNSAKRGVVSRKKGGHLNPPNPCCCRGHTKLGKRIYSLVKETVPIGREECYRHVTTSAPTERATNIRTVALILLKTECDHKEDDDCRTETNPSSIGEVAIARLASSHPR